MFPLDKQFDPMRLFISYAHADKPRVKDLIVDYLVVEGHTVWFDERLVAGKLWQDQLRDEIERSDGVVFVISPASLKSEWCEWELFTAAQLGKKILPILLDPVEALPEYLSQTHYVDFTKCLTPVAIQGVKDGLQQMSTMQTPPPASTSPQGMPPQAVNEKRPNIGRLLAIASGVIIFFVTIFGVLPEPTRNSFFVAIGMLEPTPTPTPTIAAAASPTEKDTPRATATETATAEIATATTTLPNVSALTEPVTSSSDTLSATSMQSTGLTNCTATIINDGPATVLNVVRIGPSPVTRIIDTVIVGQSVNVRQLQNVGTNGWYEIGNEEDRTIGWIPSEYLQLAGSCNFE